MFFHCLFTSSYTPECRPVCHLQIGLMIALWKKESKKELQPWGKEMAFSKGGLKFQIQASRSLMNIAETKAKAQNAVYFLLQLDVIRWFSGFFYSVNVCCKLLSTIWKSHIPHSGSFSLTALNTDVNFTAFNLSLLASFRDVDVLSWVFGRDRERMRYSAGDSGEEGEHGPSCGCFFFFLHLPFSEIQPRGWMQCPAVREIPEVIQAGFILPVKRLSTQNLHSPRNDLSMSCASWF